MEKLKNRYAIVPYEILPLKIMANSKLIFSLIYSYIRNKKEFFMSNNSIAKTLGIGERMVQKCLSELKSCNLLEIHQDVKGRVIDIKNIEKYNYVNSPSNFEPDLAKVNDNLKEVFKDFIYYRRQNNKSFRNQDEFENFRQDLSFKSTQYLFNNNHKMGSNQNEIIKNLLIDAMANGYNYIKNPFLLQKPRKDKQ